MISLKKSRGVLWWKVRCGVRKKERSSQEENSFLEESYSVKVAVEELEDLLGPDDADVDFRRVLEEARDEKGCATFETFSTDGQSQFLVASRSRWDKYKRKWNAHGDKIRQPP